MAAKKGTKGGAGGDDAEEELTRVPFQAILLADSFATLFRPITLERPKLHDELEKLIILCKSVITANAVEDYKMTSVLLPLVNSPMIDYTLAWLESAGVEEVFVFCCAHSKQVIEYLENSNWFGKPNFSVTTIESHNAISAGDALRLIYERHVIQGDFVLVTGDTVSNMSLAQALKEHKERRKKDSNAIMTMVIKQSKPSALTRQSRVGTEELFLAIDPDTKELLHYEEKSDNMKGTVNLEKRLLIDNSSLSLHNDKQDCYIDICSPEVLSLFTDNFDYQHLRRHFVKGLLVDDIMGYKIFTHEIHASYATRVDNYRSYGTISKDIIQRWTYPFVPDVRFSGNSVTRLERQGVYRASDVGLSHSARIGPFAVIGNGTTIGNYTYVSNSMIGEGCVIGSNVSIDGCYIWDKVTIEDGCKLKHAIVCDGVIMRSGSVLEPGVVLSFKVIIGEQFVVPAYSKVSLLQQPVKQDSDEELEYADNSSVNIEISSISSAPERLDEDLREKLSDPQTKAASEVGNGGVGFIWSISEAGHEEEWRHSVAPIPADRLAEMIKSATDELEVSNQDGDVLPPSGELDPGSIDSDFDGDVRDDSAQFEKEVEATFLRAVHENVKEDHIILEVNSLRLSYNLTSSDCAGALFYGIMKLALDTPYNSLGELVKNVASVITKWRRLLKYYLPSVDEEIEVILKFEEMCVESTKEYAPLFEQILPILYDKDILQEEAILDWAAEKEQADESDKVFLKQAEKFIQWLNEASEEEE